MKFTLNHPMYRSADWLHQALEEFTPVNPQSTDAIIDAGSFFQSFHLVLTSPWGSLSWARRQQWQVLRCCYWVSRGQCERLQRWILAELTLICNVLVPMSP